ncbi:MAG: hypothetical protein ACOZAA_14970 [Pseudomonadota bacterium]
MKCRRTTSAAIVLAIEGGMATSSLASYPDSWSCAYNICTGTWSTSGGPQYSAVAIPIRNPAPSTEFEPANEEFVEFEPNAVNCDVDNAAVDAALAISAPSTRTGLATPPKIRLNTAQFSLTKEMELSLDRLFRASHITKARNHRQILPRPETALGRQTHKLLRLSIPTPIPAIPQRTMRTSGRRPLIGRRQIS